MNKIILGINMSCLDTSVCLMVDSKIQFAVREERLTREKRTGKFPITALNMALNNFNYTLEDIDEIGISWNPAINLERHNTAQSSITRYKPEHFYSVPSFLFTHFQDQNCFLSSQEFSFDSGSRINIHYLNHHLCHAAEAFYLSPFDVAHILVMDAYGEKESLSIYKADDNGIRKLNSVFFPHSIGSFYGTITQFLGFTPDSDEWKVMGASSYGNPDVYFQQLMSLFDFNEKSLFELNQSYFQYQLFSRSRMYSPRLLELLGQPREESEELNQRHYDIAAATQKVVEEVVFRILTELYSREKCENLCLSGGVAMNCVMNGKILTNTQYEKLFISSAPDDGGTSVGAALYLNYKDSDAERESYSINYWGPSVPGTKIKEVLDTYKVKYQVLDDPASTAAQLIFNNNIIGWFQGRMEFGERSLGNRSILANPQDADMKDRINKAVKFREGFRPFAPAILEDKLDDYFVGAEVTPFMEKVFPVQPDKRSQISAVTHVDGTGRLQTLTEKQNPLFYNLIHEFYKLSGVPVVLNTSFNLKGEPIVSMPEHALRTFFTSGLDALIMDKYLIEKQK